MGVCYKDGQVESFRFDLRGVLPPLSEKDWRTIHYCTNHVSGLALEPYPGERVFPYTELKPLLQRCFFKRRLPGDRVAYKGGHVERDLLREMGFPSVDLETWGCPRFDELLKV